MTDLRPSPEDEFEEKETCPNNVVTLEKCIRFVYHMFWEIILKPKLAFT
jgi:hypothetical protein